MTVKLPYENWYPVPPPVCHGRIDTKFGCPSNSKRAANCVFSETCTVYRDFWLEMEDTSKIDRETVITQYEAIRRSGLTTMFDQPIVQRIAYDNGFHDLVDLIKDGGYNKVLKNYSEWMKLIDEDDIPEVEG